MVTCVLHWARSQDPPCPWDNYTCSDAAKNGHLDILEWVRSQYPPCPWDENTCSGASENGDLQVLQWLRSQDPPCPWDPKRCMYIFQQKGHIDLPGWMQAYQE